MDERREAVRQMVRRTLEDKNDTQPFADFDSLIFSGRLQSVDVLDLVLFLEERFGIDFSQGFDQAQLDSVDEIVNLLGSR